VDALDVGDGGGVDKELHGRLRALEAVAGLDSSFRQL
jgi:hypothetical protein